MEKGGAASSLPGWLLTSHPATRDEVWAPSPLLPQERILPRTQNLSHQNGAFTINTCWNSTHDQFLLLPVGVFN